MTNPSPTDSDTILAFDFGTLYTRAMLFDVVEGEYHFIAMGIAPSTVGSPYFDVGESYHQALVHLQELTGRTLLDENERLILPSNENGAGVDRMVATISAGNPLSMVICGLLEDISLKSAQRLAASLHGRVLASTGLNDRRPPAAQMDAILSADPHIIILAGGVDHGATRSVFRLADIILQVCRLLPRESRPAILYSGNQALAFKVKDVLEKLTSVFIAANIRPSIEVEELAPAQEALAEITGLIRTQQIGGLKDLGALSSAPLLPGSYTFGRMVRFLSQVYHPEKGMLGIDIGSSATTLAAAAAGSLKLSVLGAGLGSSMPRLLENDGLAEITRWLPPEIPSSRVRDYLWHKSLFPANIPADEESLLIEQAAARALMARAMEKARRLWPDTGASFEPILAGGSVLGKAPHPAQSLLVLLDGLQPTGITTLILDQHGILPGLGAVAGINSALCVQVIDSGVFLNLGTVICPHSEARFGTPILRARLEIEGKASEEIEITQGSLKRFKLAAGMEAHLHLEPLRRMTLDPLHKPGNLSLKVIGGACGLVIDARGRPIAMPSDPNRRWELMEQWAETLK